MSSNNFILFFFRWMGNIVVFSLENRIFQGNLKDKGIVQLFSQ